MVKETKSGLEWGNILSQGSVLGPVLFLCFINGLDKCSSRIQSQLSDWSDLQGDQVQGQEHLAPVVQDISTQPNLCGQRGQEGLGVGAAADHQDDKQL